MEYLPAYVAVVFGLTTIITIFLFYKATKNSWATHMILLGWLAIQGAISAQGFYTVTDTIPLRFLLLVLPPLLFIIGLFATRKGRKYIDSLDLKTLTLLHTIRIPVELVLYWLFLNRAVPELMTFEGRNLDILSGLTAPLVYYFGFVKKRLGRNVILFWNFICLGLLINIVTHAVLSLPTTFQQLAFEQPNIGVLYFPFIWLPCCVVPLVLLSHLAVIRQLVRSREVEKPVSRLDVASS